MAKKDISKILTTGSAKQRLLLIVEDNARAIYGMDKLLTDHEYNQLSDSFKKPNELRLWNEFKSYSASVGNGILNLQGVKYEVLMNYSNLRGYIILWNSIENAEVMVNSVLHEIKDPKERKRIAEKGAKGGVNLLFSKPELDQEGYLDIQIDFEKDSYTDEDGNRIEWKETPRKSKTHSLWYVMNNVKKEAEISIVKYLSWESAILEFMEDKGFNVKTYKDQIYRMTEDVYRPIISWAKYRGELNMGSPHPLIEKIIKQYAICPNIQELSIDPKQRDFFRREIMGDNG
jgi:hypothetical protein